MKLKSIISVLPSVTTVTVAFLTWLFLFLVIWCLLLAYICTQFQRRRSNQTQREDMFDPESLHLAENHVRSNNCSAMSQRLLYKALVKLKYDISFLTFYPVTNKSVQAWPPPSQPSPDHRSPGEDFSSSLPTPRLHAPTPPARAPHTQDGRTPRR